MFKRLSVFIIFLFTLSILFPNNLFASGFSRLKSAGQGFESKDEDEGKGKGDKNGKGGSGGGGKKSGPMGSGPSGLNDVIFLGVFETYIPKKRRNARLTIYAEPRKFSLGHRACTKSTKMRDKINTHLFKNPPETDKKGRVVTKGMDKGVRGAIKKGLKTKLEYFTSVYVISGRYNTKKIPKTLKGQTITDCAGVIEKKKEMDKANK